MSTISNHKSMFRAALAVSASLGALCVGAPAFAQDAAKPADEAAANDIVVTAQFRGQKLQDTPIAITAVNAAMLESRSQTDISQVAAQAPNVTLKQTGANFGPSLGASIRGIGQFDFNPSYEPGVGVYVDDVYYPTLTGSVFDLLDLDRVEILRGPQGTNAGRNSIGGSIKLFSKTPKGDGSGFVEATYGSNQRLGFRGSADFKIAENLFGRISGVYKSQDGYVDRLDYGCVNPTGGVAATRPAGKCLLDRAGNINYQAVRGVVRYEPSDKVDVTIAADYTNDDRRAGAEVIINASPPPAAPIKSQAAPGVPYDNRFLCGQYCNYAVYGQPADAAAGGVATSGANRSLFRGYGFSGTINAAISDTINLQSITAYRNYHSEFNTDTDLSPANVGFGQDVLDHRFFSEELRLNGSAGDMVDWTVGGYYSSQKTVYYTFQDIRYGPGPFDFQFIGNDPVNANTKAAFAHLAVRPAEGLTISGGVRYTKEHKDYTFTRNNPNGTPNGLLGALNGFTGIANGDRFDYRAAIDYRWSPNFLTYASIGTGFKGGGISARPFVILQATPFVPETVTSYEVGFKSDFLDRAVRLNVAAFYSDYKNIQGGLLSCPETGFPACAKFTNLGDGKYTGLEAELSVHSGPLTLDAAASYIHFKWDRISAQAGTATNPLGPQFGDRFAGVPTTKWSLGVQYEVDLGNSGTLTPRYDVAFEGDRYNGRVNNSLGVSVPTFIPSNIVGNARLTWRNSAKDLDISLEATNLFDRYYFQTYFDLRNAGSGVLKGQPGRPREWAISIKKKF
jgi:iron complex outermembrane recepter protein